jgi:ABC-type bacteriocin/lantibiotic exporter with double-glycine peptidase domain/CRP-like cAMP-binding protein
VVSAIGQSSSDASRLVGSLPVISMLPDQLRELVVGSFQERSYAFGEVIIAKGEPADAFYVLTEGVARVVGEARDGHEVSLGLLRPGDGFGESALIDDQPLPRTASVRASGPAAAARIDRAVFRSLARLYPAIADVFCEQARAARLQNFLRLDSAFSTLGSDAVAAMLRDLTEVRAAAGTQIVCEGDAAMSWWIVESGRLTVYASSPARRDLRFLRTGDFFGEIALLGAEPRSANVEATTDCVLLELPERTFRELLEQAAFRERIEERVAIYKRGPASRPVDLQPQAPEGADAPVRPERASAPPVDVADGVQLAEHPGEHAPWIAPRKFALVRQIDEADCGAACVAMLCRAFGHKVSLNHIRHAVGTGERGTTLRGIKRGGDELGLEMRALKSSVGHVASLPLPAIIHWDGNHWVVLYRVDGSHVRIADPAGRLRRMPLAELSEHWSGYVATARPTERLADAPRERLELRWLLAFLRPQRRRLAVAIALALVAAGGALVPPILSSEVIDAVTGDGGPARVNVLIAVMVAVLLVSLAASMLQRRILARTAVQLDSDTLDFVTVRLLGLPLSYFSSRRTGDIERRLNGLRELRQLMVGSLPGAVAGVLQLLVTLVIMFMYSPVIGLAFLATAPAYALLMRYSAKRLRPTFDNLEEAYGRHASKQIDAIKGIESVKSAGAEPGMRAGILGEFTRLADKVYKGDIVMMSYDAAISLTTFAIFVAFLWVAALLAIAGTLTVGQVVAVNSLVLLANGPIFALLSLWDKLQLATVLLWRLQDVLEEQAEQPEPGAPGPQPRSVPSLGGKISIRGVGLTYRDAPEKAVLQDLSIELEAGMSLGLVGRSGSGKSSLLRCLAGLLMPTAGAILYDGVDLRELRWHELRRHIGFVLQEPYLFDDTIAANIALGESEIDYARVMRAAEIADAAEFIDAMSLRYETRVGDSGLKLSGGQAQRVAIARALYHDPPILLFDEATSALDTESERAVKENLEGVMRARTSVIVAHRLSTVRDADLIGVLEQGRLVELGSHCDLMQREGLYYYLNTVQAQP